MVHRDIVVVGASAGGVETLMQLVAGLPPDFSASVFIVLHIPPYSVSHLHVILGRVTTLPVVQAEDKLRIKPGHIYVGVADHHLLLDTEHIRVTRGPKENRFRPAVDTLFRSAAYSFGLRVIGIVLTGALDDGTAGLWAVKDRGGIAMVQHPQEAMYPSMPESALRNVAIDYQPRMAEMAPLLVQLTNEAVEVEGSAPVSESMEIETKIALEDNSLQKGVLKLGPLSPYTCPECHGVLVQVQEGQLVRFRCHTGHAFSIDSLLAEVSESIDESLWSTLRVIEESILLLHHTAGLARANQDDEMARRLIQKGAEAEQRAQRIRAVVMAHETLSREQIRNQ